MTSASHTPSAGSLMVLYGATTGRDGIGGVSVLAQRHDRGGERRVAPVRADRRPVRGEAPDRGLARAGRRRVCSRGCRISAAPGSRAPSASPPRAPAWGRGWTSTSCRCASRGWRPSRSSRRSRRSGCSRSCILRSWTRSGRSARSGASRRRSWPTLEPGGDLDVHLAGEQVVEGPGAFARGEGARVRASDAVDPAETGRSRRSRRSTAIFGDALRSTSWLRPTSREAVGLRAVRPHGPGADRRRPGLGRRRRPRAGNHEGARAVGRREGRYGSSGSVPRRCARRRRGLPERRGDRREAARDHELHELRQPGAARGDVAVLRGDPRDARRVPRARHAGHGRERQLLQRIGRLGDLAHSGGRRARVARRLPTARAHRVPVARFGRLPPGGVVRGARGVRVRRDGAGHGRGDAAGARSRGRATRSRT